MAGLLLNRKQSYRPKKISKRFLTKARSDEASRVSRRAENP